MSKTDRQTNHQYNYLVIFSNKEDNFKKCLINARDKKNALRIAFNRLCRLFPEVDVSRARVADVIPAKKSSVEIDIKKGIA